MNVDDSQSQSHNVNNLKMKKKMTLNNNSSRGNLKPTISIRNVANKLNKTQHIALNDKSMDGVSTVLDNHIIIEEDVEADATYRSKARKSLKRSNFNTTVDERSKNPQENS